MGSQSRGSLPPHGPAAPSPAAALPAPAGATGPTLAGHLLFHMGKSTHSELLTRNRYVYCRLWNQALSIWLTGWQCRCWCCSNFIAKCKIRHLFPVLVCNAKQLRLWPTFRSEEHASQRNGSNGSGLFYFTFRQLSFSWTEVPSSAWLWVRGLCGYQRKAAKERWRVWWAAARESLPRTEGLQRVVALSNPHEPKRSEEQELAVQGHQHTPSAIRVV